MEVYGRNRQNTKPEKRVLMPTLEATCSLILDVLRIFKGFCENYSDHTVVVYANTSAEIKAMADWVVTSSIGLEVVEFLKGVSQLYGLQIIPRLLYQQADYAICAYGMARA